MRRGLGAIVLVGALASPSHAEQLPQGTIGLLFGAVSGTGADAKLLGYGYYQFGMQAAWQPMDTANSVGWAIRWSTMFGTLYNGTAPQIESELHTVQMDLTVGLRFRPWQTPTRYLTARIGGEMLRSNEPIPPLQHRDFIGGIAAVGLDQYVGGFMFNVDVRYGLIGNDGPTQIALLFGVGLTGP